MTKTIKKTELISKRTHSPQAKIIYHNEHGISPKQIGENALTVIKQLNNAGFQAYLVGGCVRDLLVGKHPKDFDITTNALDVVLDSHTFILVKEKLSKSLLFVQPMEKHIQQKGWLSAIISMVQLIRMFIDVILP